MPLKQKENKDEILVNIQQELKPGQKIEIDNFYIQFLNFSFHPVKYLLEKENEIVLKIGNKKEHYIGLKERQPLILQIDGENYSINLKKKNPPTYDIEQKRISEGEITLEISKTALPPNFDTDNIITAKEKGEIKLEEYDIFYLVSFFEQRIAIAVLDKKTGDVQYAVIKKGESVVIGSDEQKKYKITNIDQNLAIEQDSSGNYSFINIANLEIKETIAPIKPSPTLDKIGDKTELERGVYLVLNAIAKDENGLYAVFEVVDENDNKIKTIFVPEQKNTKFNAGKKEYGIKIGKINHMRMETKNIWQFVEIEKIVELGKKQPKEEKGEDLILPSWNEMTIEKCDNIKIIFKDVGSSYSSYSALLEIYDKDGKKIDEIVVKPYNKYFIGPNKEYILETNKIMGLLEGRVGMASGPTFFLDFKINKNSKLEKNDLFTGYEIFSEIEVYPGLNIKVENIEMTYQGPFSYYPFIHLGVYKDGKKIGDYLVEKPEMPGEKIIDMGEEKIVFNYGGYFKDGLAKVYIGDIYLTQSHQPFVIKDVFIYPNPAQKGQTINIEFTPTKKDLYYIQVVDNSGREVLVEEVEGKQINQKCSVSIKTDSLAKGVYQVRIANKEGYFYTSAGFVVN